MDLRDALLRTFVKPAWLPGPPKVERWTCAACRREVERVSPASFVALFPPHGVAFVLDHDGATYELRRLHDLAPSDLLGARAASLPGVVIGRVAVADVRFDELRAVRVVAELGLAIGDPSSGDALEGGERPAAV